jgi:hypothetical protein
MFIRPYLFLAALFCAGLSAQTQTTIIPQIADGGGWQTTIVLTNTGTSAAAAGLLFFQSTDNGSTQGWNPPFLETSSPQSLALPAASSTFLHTPGTAQTLSEGWAELQASPGVVAYAIFTQFAPGRPNQDGTAPAAPAANRILMPFDNTSGFVTTMAIANPNSSIASVTVSMQPGGGQPTALAPITLPPNGYMAFTLPQQFPSTSGFNGLLEFISSSASISIIAIRFNATGAFTASPVYAETGASIIATGSTAFNGTYTGTYTSSILSGAVTATVLNGFVTVNSPGGGSGIVSASGEITFGFNVSQSTPCSFTGILVLNGTTATGSGTFSCSSPGFMGIWSMTRQ